MLKSYAWDSHITRGELYKMKITRKQLRKLITEAMFDAPSELAKAREVLNKTSVDFVLDLRTTKHHINAIEQGELRIFYGPPFYLDLLRRYALALNFSESKIKQLEQRVTNQEDQDEGNDAPVDEKDAGGKLQESSRHLHATPVSESPRKSKIFPRSIRMSYSQLRMKEQEKNLIQARVIFLTVSKN